MSSQRVDGGARRNRTDDLFNAIEALSQLSYGPKLFVAGPRSIGVERVRPSARLITAKARARQGRSGQILRFSLPAADSGLLVGGDVAIDEIGDVVLVFFLRLEEGIVGLSLLTLLHFDVLDGGVGASGLLLGRLDLVKRN